MLTQSQLDDYERDGFLLLRGLIPSLQVAVLRNEIARLAATPPPGMSLSYEPPSPELAPSFASEAPLRKVRNIGRFSEVIFAFCTSSQVAILAKDILRSAVGFLGDQALFKPAVAGTAKPLHQDCAYFRISPPEAVITIWCSLNEADESNGCMHYIPGSHKAGIAGHMHLPGTPHLVASSLTDRLVAVPTREGDCLVHNSLTLHMTPPNSSQRPRLALLAHYVRLNATIPPRSADAPPIVPLPHQV